MEEVRIWEEEVIIPTYEIGAAEKNPIFSEKRVYQGSSGRVYPYPVIAARHPAQKRRGKKRRERWK